VASLEARTRDLDSVLRSSGQRSAVIYPIVLESRLELLVTFPDGVRRYSSDVSAQRLAQVGQFFRRRIRLQQYTYRAPGRALYDWLVAPLASDLDAQGIETVVFVPGAALSALPFAALWDGERFLVERFAVAVAPGLSMVDPEPLDVSDKRFLVAGLSEAAGGFAPLPYVEGEVTALRSRYGGELLLDEDFEQRRFEERLAADQPGVVHIASHAVFGGDPSQSFVVSHDGRITLDEMAAALQRTQYREQPVELLVLSACETAAGNDRAALGLAGVAIRSGVRSALGSLWSINDETTSTLMLDFYAALQEPNVSKAEALRRAQLALLSREAYRHPFYWSPFVLLSNWM
jgi:CHAT domain-containing protein